MPRGHPGQVKQTTKKQTAKKQGNHGNLPGPGPGRPKGVPNKVNRDLKEAYLMAANLAGGKEGTRWLSQTKKQCLNVRFEACARPDPRHRQIEWFRGVANHHSRSVLPLKLLPVSNLCAIGN